MVGGSAPRNDHSCVTWAGRWCCRIGLGAYRDRTHGAASDAQPTNIRNDITLGTAELVVWAFVSLGRTSVALVSVGRGGRSYRRTWRVVPHRSAKAETRSVRPASVVTRRGDGVRATVGLDQAVPERVGIRGTQG